MRTFFLIIFTLALFATVLSNNFCSSDFNDDPDNQYYLDNRIARHGYSVMTHRTKPNIAYITHMPTYERPHDYQQLLVVEIETKDTTLKLNTYYEFNSFNFSLNALLNETIDSFTTDLYTNKTGPVAETNVLVTVHETIFAKNLINTEQKTDFPNYMVYGGVQSSDFKGEYYLMHIIEGLPNFDYLISATIITNRLIEDGEIISFENYQNIVEKRFDGSSSFIGHTAEDQQIVILENVKELNCRAGDHVNGHCPAIANNMGEFKFLN